MKWERKVEEGVMLESLGRYGVKTFVYFSLQQIVPLAHNLEGKLNTYLRIWKQDQNSCSPSPEKEEITKKIT